MHETTTAAIHLPVIGQDESDAGHHQADVHAHLVVARRQIARLRAVDRSASLQRRVRVTLVVHHIDQKAQCVCAYVVVVVVVVFAQKRCSDGGALLGGWSCSDDIDFPSVSVSVSARVCTVFDSFRLFTATIHRLRPY